MRKQHTSRVTVNILCMIVDSDGMPVDGYGEMLEGDERPYYEWHKRRISTNRFCLNDLADPKRRTVKYRLLSSATAAKCRCHDKLRLVRYEGASR